MWERLKDYLTAECLHALKYFLGFFPVHDGGLECLILLLGQRDRHGFTFHFAGPLIARASRTRTAILHVALTDPAEAAQAGLQPRVFDFEFGVHAEKSSMAVNRAVYIPLYQSSQFHPDLPRLVSPPGAHEARTRHYGSELAPTHTLPTRSALADLPASPFVG